jgi:acyl-CoA synthetase (NDP forming)
VLSLKDEPSVAAAYRSLSERLGAQMLGAIVQTMASGGVEVMIGATEHPTFGHVVAYGAGGTLVELLSDVAFRIEPLTEVDAQDLVAEARCSKLLDGFRGAPPADRAALTEILLRVSALIDIAPEIRELDINPLKVLEHGAVVVDARVNLQPIVPGPPSRRVRY